MKLLLTGVGGSASANFLDSIRISNLPIEVLGIDNSQYMIALSNLTLKYLAPNADSPQYMDFVNNIINKHKCDVVHAQPDAEVRMLSQKRQSLEARIFLPTDNAIQTASDKENFAKIMRRNDIPVPQTGAGKSENEIKEICKNLFLNYSKLWVRARVGAGSKASLPVSKSEQALNWIKWWIEEKNMKWSDFQISEFLPGAEYALQTIWQDGTLISAEARERISYLYGFLSPSGQSSTPSVAKTTTKPDVYELGIRSIQALDPIPNGVYCVDMKTDQYGEIKVTEINAGRFFTTSNFFAHAGVNMPAMSILAAVGERLKPIPIASLGDNLYWIRMVDMGYKLIKENEIVKDIPARNF
jgi:carbamoylphosphate synthase large subunit